MQRLTAVMQKFAFELQRRSENEQHEREKQALQFRNDLLQLEHRRPPTRDE